MFEKKHLYQVRSTGAFSTFFYRFTEDFEQTWHSLGVLTLTTRSKMLRWNIPMPKVWKMAVNWSPRLVGPPLMKFECEILRPLKKRYQNRTSGFFGVKFLHNRPDEYRVSRLPKVSHPSRLLLLPELHFSSFFCWGKKVSPFFWISSIGSNWLQNVNI